MRRENRWRGRLLAWRRGILLATLALVVASAAPNAERIGDRLQIALPVLGLGCAVLTGGAGEYLLRYGLGTALVHGIRAGLGRRPLNTRPNGGGNGFPSGHSAAAAYGASALVYRCVTKSPLVQGLVIIAAGFTGASRIEAGAHDIWQVLAGVLIGWGSDRLLRRQSPVCRRLRAWLSRPYQRRRRQQARDKPGRN